MRKMVQKFGEKFLITREGTPEQEIDTANKNIPKLNKAFTENKRRQEFSYKTMHYLHIASEWLAFTATITLFIFVVQLSQAIVWG